MGIHLAPAGPPSASSVAHPGSRRGGFGDAIETRLAQTSKVRTKRKLKRTFGTVRLERPFGTSTVGPSSLTGTHLSRTVTHSGSRYTVYGPAEVESNG